MTNGRMRTVDAASGYHVETVKLESIPTQRSAALESTKSLKWNKPLKLVCQWCNARFTNHKFRLFCGDECRMAAYNAERRYPWNQKELDYLASQIGTYPITGIIHKFRQRFDVTESMLSQDQIYRKIVKIAQSEGLRIRNRDDNLCMSEWARVLNMPKSTFRNLVMEKGIKHESSGTLLKTLKRTDIKKYILSNPLPFDEIPIDVLTWLFDGNLKPLIASATAMIEKSAFVQGARRKVVCVETGQIFQSIQSAAKHCNISISQMLKRLASRQAVWLPVSVRTNEKAPFHFAYYFNLVHGWGKKYG